MADWLAGSWPDVVPLSTGFALARVLADKRTVEVMAGTSFATLASVWTQDLGAGNDVQWLRATVNPATDDVYVFVHRSVGAEDRGYIVHSGGVFNLPGGDIVWGLRAGALAWEGGQLVLYLLISQTQYVRWVDPLVAAMPAASATPWSTNYGFRYITPGNPGTPNWVTIDAAGHWHVDANGLRFSVVNGLTVGQGSSSDFTVLVHPGGAQAVIPVKSFEMFVAPFGDGSGLYAVAARTISQGGKFAALAVGPPWSGPFVTSGGGGTLSPGSDVPRSPRKTGSPPPKIAGGVFSGIGFTDPAGRLATLPFKVGGTGIITQGGPAWTPPSDFVQTLLDAIAGTWGSILYRGQNDWVALAPGTAGQVLQTNGPNANPSWAAGGAGDFFMSPLTIGGDPAAGELVFAPDGDVVMVPEYF